jgi:hypothetical protein
MAFLFKNKQKKVPLHANSIHNKIAVGVVQRCIAAQTRWASYMQRKTEKLSCSAKKYCLLLFCMVSVGCSFYLLTACLRHNTGRDLRISSINVPVHSTESGEENTRSFLLITKKEFQRIERFRRYLDSLGRSERGKILRDRILFTRPGLMDSIRVVEKLYQLQSIKK